MTKLLFPALSYKLTGLCFRAHKKLGRFCREKQYGDELESLLQENRIIYKREYEIKNLKPGSPSGNKVDFLIENNKIILEIKAKKFITKDDYNQMQRYLQSSGLELGLIVNFRNTHLKPKRVLNIKLYSDNSDVDLDNSERYQILEHPAELRIRVFGETIEALFKNAAFAMAEMLMRKKPTTYNQQPTTKIEIKSADINSLLVDFLSEILAKSQINKCVYEVIDLRLKVKGDEAKLEVEINSIPVERFDEDIKAVTYEDLDIHQQSTPLSSGQATNNQQLWTTDLVFDI